MKDSARDAEKEAHPRRGAYYTTTKYKNRRNNMPLSNDISVKQCSYSVPNSGYLCTFNKGYSIGNIGAPRYVYDSKSCNSGNVRLGLLWGMVS